MPQIYLSHPKHGIKIASLEAEAEHDEQHGWVRYTEPTPSLPNEAAPVNVLEIKRRGRPPKITRDNDEWQRPQATSLTLPSDLSE